MKDVLFALRFYELLDATVINNKFTSISVTPIDSDNSLLWLLRVFTMEPELFFIKFLCYIF